MNQIHSAEKEQFEKLFAGEDVESFDEVFRVLETFLQIEQHVTVEELVRHFADKGEKIEPEFVRETLELMCRFGFAQQHSFDNGEVRYEHRHLGHHHDHMVCTKCRKIIEFSDKHLENLQIQLAEAFGFHMLQHRMEIYGICADCLKTRVKRMTLASARQGEILKIMEISGGTGARLRLLTMGLRVGDRIEVVTNLDRGQMVVALAYSRYVIGRGLAQKILVEPVAPEEAARR
jgi:Fur family transcriptional regulator, ferric uptake regulator